MSGNDGTPDSRVKDAPYPTINKDGTPCGGTVLPGATGIIGQIARGVRWERWIVPEGNAR